MKTHNIDYYGSIPAFLQSLVNSFGGGIETHAFALRYGRSFTPSPLPKGIRPGPPKQCFSVAAKLALQNPNFVYVEGFARRRLMIDPPIPFEHAWVVDAAGNVIDPTWVRPPGEEYFGVPFQTEFLRTAIHKGNQWGFTNHASLPELKLLLSVAWLHPIASNPQQKR